MGPSASKVDADPRRPPMAHKPPLGPVPQDPAAYGLAVDAVQAGRLLDFKTAGGPDWLPKPEMPSRRRDGTTDDYAPGAVLYIRPSTNTGPH